MMRQTARDDVGRSRRRVGLVAAATILLSMAGGPAVHADDGGLLGGAVGVVEATAEQVVQPTVETVTSTAPQPVQEVVEPVEEAVEPTVAGTEQSGQEAVRVVDQAAAPVVRVVKEAASSPEEPRKEPVAQPAPASAPPPARAPATGDAGASHAGHASDTDRPGDVRAAPLASGDHEQRRAQVVGGSGLWDLAPRAMGRGAILLHDPEPDDPTADEELRSLTNELMHMWAGENAPGAIDAGLAGREATGIPALAPSSNLVPLVLGLLLGMLALVLARRSAGAR